MSAQGQPRDTPSTFPHFQDGDVLITLSPTRTYNLHASILRHSSSHLAMLLGEEAGATLSAKARKAGVTTRYHIELTITRGGNQGLISKPVNSHGHSQGLYFLADIENGKILNPTFKHYDNLFRSFYNVRLEINTKNLATVLHDCMGLVDTAETYGALNCVMDSVDAALLRQGQTLFKSIYANPVAWANFGEKIQSTTIYKEAMIHLIGKWKLLTPEERAKLSNVTTDIIERKHHEVQMVKQALEIRMISHYPQHLQKDPNEHPGRIDYAGDIYGWMVITLFCHWFGTQCLEKLNKDKDDGGASFYYKLIQGGQAYLTREDCAHFHLYAPMTPKGMTVFENHLNAYKEEIGQFVMPLMRNKTQLEIDLMKAQEAPKYLLNAEILDEDCPWWRRGQDAVSLYD